MVLALVGDLSSGWELLEVLRFIKGLKEGPLNALGFFYYYPVLAWDVGLLFSTMMLWF